MVHLYKLNGYNIVLDIFSGSVHAVDDVAFDAISMYETHTPEEIKKALAEKYKNEGVTSEDLDEVLSDILELKEGGKLFTEDQYADKAFDFKNRHTEIKALCLHVAHTCNLNCTYCFAAQGKYHGERALMSFETGKRALDFLVENSGNRRNLEVDFFGGEPLLNFEVVKQLVAYARSIEDKCGKHFRFTLTTNGVLLDDEVTEFANRECHNVVLSLDGRKEVHDRLRKTINGKGSYDTIVPKFQKFVKARGDKGYYVRGTFTHNNTDFTNDIFHMADLGFTELSMEPVVCAPGEEYALTEEDLPVLFEQYEILAKEMLRREREGRPFTFYHYMLDLTGGPCIYKRISGCGSGTEYLAVTPWGELYPCHQFVGDPKYSMGNIWDGVTNKALQDEFKLCNAYARPDCKDCWAKLYCSGGCAANAYHATGSITGTYHYGCELFKKRIECAIMLKVAEALGDAEPEKA
ncbi:MAG TPA: thioether cross-link-forming SCIFF peptide maturase [Candidatus Fimenecus excrementavium]|nr:thioether cross-link-forming SCIFF peptide maturase [Candidatus Fimenecus excrementavium]